VHAVLIALWFARRDSASADALARPLAQDAQEVISEGVRFWPVKRGLDRRPLFPSVFPRSSAAGSCASQQNRPANDRSFASGQSE
jgi:hypothetical protein